MAKSVRFRLRLHARDERETLASRSRWKIARSFAMVDGSRCRRSGSLQFAWRLVRRRYRSGSIVKLGGALQSLKLRRVLISGATYGAELVVDDMRIERLVDSTDVRGLSFSILSHHMSLIGPARDVHIGEIRPGRIRGNHFHATRGELIAVVFSDRWSLHWDTGPDTMVHASEFDGSGAVLVVPPNNWSHAVKNGGERSLWIIAISDIPHDRNDSDPGRRDAIERIVVE